jgi:hypothetical protein
MINPASPNVVAAPNVAGVLRWPSERSKTFSAPIDETSDECRLLAPQPDMPGRADDVR